MLVVGFTLTSPDLLSCFCLLTLSGLILGQENGPEIVKVTEGSDVILPCSLNTKENIKSKLFVWRKDGQKEVFLYDAGIHSNNGRSGQDEQFKGRVSHFEDELKSGNASIIIRNTKVADSGNYTCVFPRVQPERQIFHIHLVVARTLKDRSGENPGAASKPYITILDQTNDGALLQCEVQGASTKPKVEWQDRAGNNLPAEEPQVSERGGRYNIILQTTVTKTDYYRCVATQEEISHQTQAETFVHLSARTLKDRSDENPGAASKPYITILDETKDWSLLQCEVQGASTKPKVEWQDRAGNNLTAKEPQVSERGGRYNIILQTTVNKTDYYRCVATQEEISHQTRAEIHVYIHEFPTGLVVGGVIVTLLVFAGILAVLVFKGCIKLNCKKGSPTETSVPLNS